MTLMGYVTTKISLGFLTLSLLFFSGSALAEAKKKTEGRKKIITSEARRKKDSTNLDFDAIDISGERKVPLGSSVSQRKSDEGFDLIKIRYDWRPEIQRSTSILKSGS